MIRVGDLDASLRFYEEGLGMTLLRKQEYPGGRFTLAFVGYENEARGAVIELTYNWDQSNYNHGSAFGHIAIGVEDIHAACAHVREHGGTVVRDPGPMKHGTTVLAFVEDPDAYRIELIQIGAA